jgi:predicted regulator of amino acid metabolism with ACT domain
MTNNENTKYEIIKFEDGDFSLDDNVSPNEETVWLTQAQIAELYDVDRSRVTRHINNILQEGELPFSVCAENAHTASDGKIYNVKFYNLDMVLAVGYRVNSYRGMLFRRWANTILKQYLLSGQVINENRCLAHSDNIIKMNNIIESMNTRMDNFKLRLDSITSTTYFKDKIFYDGQLYEGYSFIKNLFEKATNRIIIIDSYLDYSVLEMMMDINVDISIYIASHTPLSNREISLFQTNHNLDVIRTNSYHDRFIIIDSELYNIGSSIKDIGKKISHISKLESICIEELLNRYI